MANDDDGAAPRSRPGRLPLPLPAQTPKHGGVLTLMQREELPQGLSILATSTIATVWPATR